MSKNVTSYDPRKPGIVAALKKKTGAKKITMVKEISPGVFQGRCIWRPDGTEVVETVTSEEAGDFGHGTAPQTTLARNVDYIDRFGDEG